MRLNLSIHPKNISRPWLNRENGLICIEQILNSAWNFGLGAFVAKWADIQTFGFFAAILSVYFILTAAISAMTIGVIAVDASRLRFSRHLYLHHARRGAEKAAILVLAGGICAIWAIAWRAPDDERVTIGVLGSLYLTANVILDIRRRILALQKNMKLLLSVALFRIFSLGLLVFCANYWFRNRGLEAVTCGAALVSVLSMSLFAFCNPVLPGRVRGLGTIAFARQIRKGGWLFASSIAGNFFEQGIAIASGMNGLPQLVGAWRAASFLFGFLNPLLQITDLLLPRITVELIGRQPSLRQIGIFTGLFGSLAAAFTFFIAVLNAEVWLPYLGPSYAGFGYVAFWYWPIYTSIVIRTSLMPFLKTKAPISIFAGSLSGNISGILVFMIAGTWSLNIICLSVFVANAVSLVSNILTLIFLHYWPLKLQAYPKARARPLALCGEDEK